MTSGLLSFSALTVRQFLTRLGNSVGVNGVVLCMYAMKKGLQSWYV